MVDFRNPNPRPYVINFLRLTHFVHIRSLQQLRRSTSALGLLEVTYKLISLTLPRFLFPAVVRNLKARLIPFSKPKATTTKCLLVCFSIFLGYLVGSGRSDRVYK